MNEKDDEQELFYRYNVSGIIGNIDIDMYLLIPLTYFEVENPQINATFSCSSSDFYDGETIAASEDYFSTFNCYLKDNTSLYACVASWDGNETATITSLLNLATDTSEIEEHVNEIDTRTSNVDSSVYQDRIAVTTSDGTIIARLNGNTGTFYVDNVVCKELTTDTIINEDGENVLEAITDEVDEKLSEISSTDLSKWTMYTIGDSLCAANSWQKETVAKTKINWDSSKNTKKNHWLSLGGRSTSGGIWSGVWRTYELINGVDDDTAEPYLGNDKGKNHVVVFENIIDNGNAIDMSSTYASKNPRWYAYSLETFSSDLLASLYDEDKVSLSDCIKTGQTAAAGYSLSINSAPSKAGSFEIQISSITNIGTVTFKITVESGDTADDIVNKIVEYDYSTADGASCVKEDGLAVFGLTSTSHVISIVNDTVSLDYTWTSDVETMTYTMRVYQGSDTTEENWTNTSNWSTNFYFTQAWKTCIEMIQSNYPYTKILLVNFPRHDLSSTTWGENNYFKRDDGTYDVTAYRNAVNSSYTYDRQRETNFETLGDYYSIDVLDLAALEGISVSNFYTFYDYGNVHPRTVGYYRWGDIIAEKLVQICLAEGEQD